jgi:hypothetical protein
MNKNKLITPDQRFGFCLVAVAPIRKEPSEASEIVSQLLFGEPIEVQEFGRPWVKIQSYLDGYEGYIDGKHILPLTPKELKKWSDSKIYLATPFTYLQTPWGKQLISKGSLVGDSAQFKIGDFDFELHASPLPASNDLWGNALDYLNTPYLWGGKSIFGIDCSGFTQAIFRLQGINLPRDAYEQEELGESIDFEEAKLGDLAFFKNKDGKVIHVGIIGENNQIIHASGRVRIDELKENGIWNEEMELMTHNLSSIKRVG